MQICNMLYVGQGLLIKAPLGRCIYGITRNTRFNTFPGIENMKKEEHAIEVDYLLWSILEWVND